MSSNRIAQLKPADLPAPPQAALRILHACSDEATTTQQVAELAASDPVLTTELLRIVNTPLFGMSRKIQSLNQAITILGQRAVRNLVLCLAMRDAIKQNPVPGFDIGLYWEDTLRRAISARLLAGQLQLNQDDCFTYGLLQDFGMLVMFYFMPELSDEWPALQQLNPAVRYQRERELFGVAHTEMNRLIAQAWSLPDSLGMLLASHHHCDTSPLTAEQQTLCRVLFCADWMAAVFTAADKTRLISHTRQQLGQHFQLDNEQVIELLARVPGETQQAAGSLGLHINPQAELEQILSQANSKLAEANLSYQELTWKLEQTLRERDRLAQELNQELQLAREIQESLLPKDVSADFPVNAINISARDLSGDFYDYFQLPDGRIYFNLADVSGKGINAALLMAKTSSLFHCLGKHIHDPARLLEQLNNEIAETTIRGMFVTMIAGIYNPQDGSVKLVNAGHPPALLIGQDNSVQTLAAMGPPLGIMPDTAYPAPQDLYLDGGSLYLFSDGVSEGEIEPGEMLGIEKLARLLISMRQQPARQRLHSIVKQFRQHGQPLHDDLTILLVEAARHG